MRRVQGGADSDAEGDEREGTPPPGGAGGEAGARPQKGGHSAPFYRTVLRRVKRMVQHIKQVCGLGACGLALGRGT